MNSKRFSAFLFAIPAFVAASGEAFGQPFIEVVAPNGQAQVEGNTLAGAPFDGALGTMRYQQVFDASQFSAIQNGGGYISAIGFRHDGSCAGGDGQTIQSLQINLSTTSARPDQLSSVFADNVGHDDSVVFAPSSITLFGGCAPQSFTVFIGFNSPFFYNPNAGNLLLDIRNLSGPANDGTQFLLDAQDTTGDSVSRLLAFNVNATSAQIADSSGLVTDFVMQPVPEPGTWALLALGLGGLAFSIHCKSKRRRDAAE